MRDEDRYKKEHHGLKVGVAILGVFVAIGGVVFRCSQRQQQREDLENAMRVQQMIADLPRPDEVARAAPPAEPVEFEVAIDGETRDVVLGETIALPDGGSFRLEATPAWVENGPGYHLTHARQVSVTRGAGDTMFLAADGAHLQLSALAATGSDAEVLDGLTAPLWSTGQMGAARAVERDIAGGARAGTAYDTTTGMVVEAFVVPVGKQRVGVMLYVTTPAADVAPLAAALASLGPGAAEVTPQFEARSFADPPVPVRIGRPAKIDVQGRMVAFTVERRATVRRVVGTMMFEHPRELIAAQVPNGVIPMVTLQSEEVTVQLADLGMPITVEELQASMLGGATLRPLGEVTRTHGGETVRGRKMALVLGEAEVMTELFLIERGGKHLAALVQYAAENEARAVALSTPIVASVR